MHNANEQRLLIAQKLKELREAEGLTQAEVGRLTGKAFTTVASWESGKSQPDINTLFSLLRIYKIENVLEEFGYLEESHALTRQERTHLEVFCSLGKQAQTLVQTLAQGLLDMQGAEQWIPAVARNGKAEGVLLQAPDCTLTDEGWQGEEQS